MKYYQGRLVDHLHLKVSDFEKSLCFYKNVLGSLGFQVQTDTDNRCFYFDELYVSEDSQFPTKGLHFAVQAPKKEAVDEFYRLGLINGGTDNGKPGERNYHNGYYACYLLDPDGNNIEAKFDMYARKSAESIEVVRKYK